MKTIRLISAVMAVFVIAAGSALADTAVEYNAHGVALYNEGRYLEAVDAFVEAYDLRPNDATIRRNLGNAYQAAAHEVAKRGGIRDFITAAEMLESAIGLDPGNPLPLVQLGSYYLRLDYNEDAMFRLEEAVELAPDNLDGRELLGNAYYKRNQLAQALEQWYFVRDHQPGRPGIDEKIAKAEREASVEGNFRETHSRNFDISFAPGTQGRDLRTVMTLLERAYRDVGTKLGRTFPPGPIQVTLYTADDFQAATQLGAHIGAVWDGRIRIPHIDSHGRLLSDDRLEELVYHEYTHEVINYLAGSDNVPWWVNEGLAELFSTDLEPHEYAALNEAWRNGETPSYRQMNANQLYALAPDQLGMAYLKSHATMRFLWDRFGQRPLLQFLNDLGDTVPAEEAFQRRYSRGYEQLEAEMKREVAKQAGR